MDHWTALDIRAIFDGVIIAGSTLTFAPRVYRVCP